MFPLPVGNVVGECRLTILSSSEIELKTKEIFFKKSIEIFFRCLKQIERRAEYCSVKTFIRD